MKCPNCNGFKKVSELGFMRKTCPQCLGVGHVKDEEMCAPEIKNDLGDVPYTTLPFQKKTKSKLNETLPKTGEE